MHFKIKLFLANLIASFMINQNIFAVTVYRCTAQDGLITYSNHSCDSEQSESDTLEINTETNFVDTGFKKPKSEHPSLSDVKLDTDPISDIAVKIRNSDNAETLGKDTTTTHNTVTTRNGTNDNSDSDENSADNEDSSNANSNDGSDTDTSTDYYYYNTRHPPGPLIIDSSEQDPAGRTNPSSGPERHGPRNRRGPGGGGPGGR